MAFVDMGIAGFGLSFGRNESVAATVGDYVSDPERVLKLGCHTYHRADEDVHATDLAAAAAEEVLAELSVTPDQIDLVVLAMSEMPEYQHYDSAAALARMLKIERTQTLLLNEGCGSGLTGLYYVASSMAMQPEIQTALFVAVNRVGEFHRNRMNVNNSVHSDGAVATLVQRGHGSYKWLATEQFTDPKYCDMFRTDFGGTRFPLPPEGGSGLNTPSGYEKVHEHFGRDPKRLRKFLDERIDRIHEVIDRACKRAGLTRDDIDHVLYINDSAPGIAAIADPLGIPAERTNAAISPFHGHMGAADQLVSLALKKRQDELKPGEIVALCGMSTGMHWCATLIQV
ncbi:3-oxoacyl-ACP synthase [Pseudonocardiaceae bacterium YIM PH 21723]|nr:3-oxoacyl-ACP synthase [Pseudonocardiaceae bacterium YIM PH 21723]